MSCASFLASSSLSHFRKATIISQSKNETTVIMPHKEQQLILATLDCASVLLDTHPQCSLSTSPQGNPRHHFEVRSTLSSIWVRYGQTPDHYDFDQGSKSTHTLQAATYTTVQHNCGVTVDCASSCLGHTLRNETQLQCLRHLHLFLHQLCWLHLSQSSLLSDKGTDERRLIQYMWPWTS